MDPSSISDLPVTPAERQEAVLLRAQTAQRAGLWGLQQARRLLDQLEEFSLDLEQVVNALYTAINFAPDPETALELALLMNDRMLRSGLWAEWQPLVEACLDRSQGQGSRATRFFLLQALGDTLALRGEWQQAIPILLQAIEIRSVSGPDWYLPYGRMAECLLALGRTQESLDLLQSAHQTALDQKDEVARLVIEGQIPRLLALQGDWEAVLARHATALEESRRRGSTEQTLSNLNFLGQAYGELGRTQEARQCYEEALQICRLIGERSGEGIVLTNLGNLAKQENNLEEARAHLEAALGIQMSLDHLPKRAITLTAMAALCVLENDLDTAEAFLEDAEGYFPEGAPQILIARIARVRADLYRRLGQEAAAGEQIARARTAFLASGDYYHARLLVP